MKLLRFNRLHARAFLLLTPCLLICFASTLQAQYTKVTGTVTDSVTGEPLPFVNIAFKGKNIGTITDMNGYYELNSQWASNTIMASFVGYSPAEKAVTIGEKQQINFTLKPSIRELRTVEIKADKGKRYRNKENPAVTLIRNVIEHKDENRMTGELYDYFEYEKYEKDEYDLNNFTEEWTKRKSLQSFKVVFDYIDTSDVNGKPYIPVLIKEKVSHVYFRKSPRVKREVVEAMKLSGFENSVFGDGVSQFLEKLTSQIDIYDNNINLLDKSFTSPISVIGPNVYRYYITDSSLVDGKRIYELAFMPRDPQTIAFTGKMLVGDSTGNYAIRDIELNVDKRININFLEGLKIEQQFEWKDQIGWVITQDRMTVDIQLAEKGLGVYNTKTISYTDFKLNIPREDELYSGVNIQVVQDSAKLRSDTYWDKARHQPLNRQEQGIYEMADTIQNLPAFKTVTTIGEFLLSGYIKAGKVDLGPVTSALSYNDVEGIRLRVGGRTNLKFSENVRLTAYAAYGLNDELWKYSGIVDYYFSKIPLTKLHVSYTDDIYQPGFEVDWSDKDNIFLSFRRTPANNMLYKKDARVYLQKEWFLGLVNTFQVNHKRISATSRNPFFENDPETPDIPSTIEINEITSLEFTFETRFAIDEKYVQGRFNRSSIKTTAPVFNLNYTYAPGGVSDYEFHKIYLGIEKRFKLGLFGFTDLEVEGAKLWGKVAYPLLIIHRGNETFSFDDRSYNLMNFLEFASDQAVGIMFTHHFNGVITSHVPLLDRLKLRAVASGKLLVRDIVGESIDQTDPSLIAFPERMSALDEGPYAEVSAGLENILKFFRLELVKRMTYLDNEGVNNLWGIKGLAVRGKIQLSF